MGVSKADEHHPSMTSNMILNVDSTKRGDNEDRWMKCCKRCHGDGTNCWWFPRIMGGFNQL